MESIIKDDIQCHFNKNCSQLFENQFAFVSKKSTNLQLLKYLNTIISNVSNGFQVDSIYLDFAKAFDTVVHSKLLSKLSFYGVKGNLLKWIESFLAGR